MGKSSFPKILIFGKNGQVGFELCRSLSYVGEVSTIDIDECDLTDKKSILENLNAFMPSIIVNAAAYTAVDKAESERELAFKLNAEAPRTMADWANKHKALMVHYSTDYVFDGTKDGPWTEEDKPNPLNVYGESKLSGDLNIQNSGCDHLIFRTSWVYGARGKNFYLTMRKLIQEKDKIRVIDDQYGAPTWCRPIADVTSLVLAKLYDPANRENLPNYSGIYNLTNSGQTSWYGFAKAIHEQLENDKLKTKLANIFPIKSSEYSVAAERPKNSILDGHKLQQTFSLSTLDWHYSLQLI